MTEKYRYVRDIERSKMLAGFALGRMNYEWNDLKGKTILDVGAAEGDMARVGQIHGVNIISIDLHPFLADEMFSAQKSKGLIQDPNLSLEATDRRSLKRNQKPKRPNGFLQGDAVHLPFKNESFDIVFTHAGPPITWTDNIREAEIVISEMMRVLKPDGECRLSPASPLNPFDNNPRGMELTLLLLKKYATDVQHIRFNNKANTQYFKLTKNSRRS